MLLAPCPLCRTALTGVLITGSASVGGVGGLYLAANIPRRYQLRKRVKTLIQTLKEEPIFPPKEILEIQWYDSLLEKITQEKLIARLSSYRSLTDLIKNSQKGTDQRINLKKELQQEKRAIVGTYHELQGRAEIVSASLNKVQAQIFSNIADKFRYAADIFSGKLVVLTPKQLIISSIGERYHHS